MRRPCGTSFEKDSEHWSEKIASVHLVRSVSSSVRSSMERSGVLMRKACETSRIAETVANCRQMSSSGVPEASSE